MVVSWVVNWHIFGSTPLPTVRLDGAVLRTVETAALRPPVTAMLHSLMVGAALVWPAWRLTQLPRRDVVVLGDVCVLLLLSQVVLLALSFLAQWNISHLFLVDAMFVTWVVAAALCVRVGLDTGRRCGAAAACGMLHLGGWLLGAMGWAQAALWSPWGMVKALEDPLQPAAQEVVVRVAWLAAGVAVVWLAAGPKGWAKSR